MIKYDKKNQPIETIHMTIANCNKKELHFLHRRTLTLRILQTKNSTSRSAAYCFSVTQASFLFGVEQVH